MTESEIKRWVEYKKEVVAELQSHGTGWYLDRYREALLDTDKRIGEYCCENILHPDRHNLYEILSVRRFFGMLDKCSDGSDGSGSRNGWSWDKKTVRRFVKFYESLKFSGLNGRRRYKLTPVQTFQFANLFGFRDEYGNRLVQNAIWFVPRKSSKTTSAAALAVWELLFGDDNAHAYVAANSYNQAKLCFDEIRKIVWGIDPGGRHFKVNRETISWKRSRKFNRDSSAECLSGKAETKDGLNASLVIVDEFSQAKDTKTHGGSKLKDALTTSMGARKNHLCLVITTASDVLDGPFIKELEGAEAVLRGEKRNDRLFASLFMPDADDREDDPGTWSKVQPHLGITVQKNYYADEWQNAQMSADDLLAFRTKLLNIFVRNEESSWFTTEKARSLLGDFDIDRVEGRPMCCVAFDLSVKDDFSAVTYTVFDDVQKRFCCHTEYYFPEGQLEKHPNRELYREWHREGYLKFCDGDIIDVSRIADDIIRRGNAVTIVRISYDSYKAQDLQAILANVGGSGTLQPYKQTYGSFNLPVESFEMMAYHSPPLIVLNNNPINAYCLSNCYIDEDRLENKKPIKISRNRKIDGTITMLMTIGAAAAYEP